jgi:2-amino-4-hydroxy-6-hydroxymethyldihydropteridine diphosphokinase
MSTLALIGLGANLGNPMLALKISLDALRQLSHDNSLEVSGLYKSAPVDAEGPDYFNAVASLNTELSAVELLCAMQAIENKAGRVRSYVNAPRTLDLDLLLFGDLQMRSDTLWLPHPRMHQRAFVLRPLLDLGLAQLLIPPHGTVESLEVQTQGQRIEKLPMNWQLIP